MWRSQITNNLRRLICPERINNTAEIFSNNKTEPTLKCCVSESTQTIVSVRNMELLLYIFFWIIAVGSNFRSSCLVLTYTRSVKQKKFKAHAGHSLVIWALDRRASQRRDAGSSPEPMQPLRHVIPLSFTPFPAYLLLTIQIKARKRPKAYLQNVTLFYL